MSVPKATPSTLSPRPNTSNVLAPMFIMFCVMAINIGTREFCMPMYHPDRLNRPSMAGAPHISMLKYIEASLLTSAGGCITSIDASRSGTCSTMSAKATAMAIPKERQSIRTVSVRSRLPRACPVSPLVPMRRNPNIQ